MENWNMKKRGRRGRKKREKWKEKKMM